jgi:hypothetical protein
MMVFADILIWGTDLNSDRKIKQMEQIYFNEEATWIKIH